MFGRRKDGRFYNKDKSGHGIRSTDFEDDNGNNSVSVADLEAFAQEKALYEDMVDSAKTTINSEGFDDLSLAEKERLLVKNLENDFPSSSELKRSLASYKALHNL